VLIGGRRVNDSHPKDRNIAMVFQSYALYPHMTVLQNMTASLRVAGVSASEANEKAGATARSLGIEHLLHRKPAKLSGGERQRVALGRAMIRNPICYLMDEPLSNLDLKLREHMRTEIKRLHQKFKVTTIYVTHDQTEALVLSDRIAVMNKGEILQVADPVTIYEKPATTFVADFVGSPSINFLKSDLRRGVATVAGRALDITRPGGDRAVTLGIRPEDIVLGQPGTGIFDGRVAFVEVYGSVVIAFIEPQGVKDVLARRDFVAAAVDIHEPIPAGKIVGVQFRKNRVSVFDAADGAALPC
jgi:multiple sugar transport system ATP-binding protein